MDEPKQPLPPTGADKFPLVSPRGGVSLATRTWAPSRGKAKGLVLLVHGGGWHSGYFCPLAERLTSEALFVAAYDQPGCGYSKPDPSAPTGCQHVQSFDDLIDEVNEAIEWAKKEAGNESLPIFLLGESYGGILVLGTALQEQADKNLKGAIVLGSLLRLAQATAPPWIVTKILPVLARYYPRLKLPATDFSNTFDEAFGDKRWAAVARSDPKIDIFAQFTVGAAAATLGAGEILLAKAPDFPIPLLAIHGERDCRTQCEAVQEFVDRVGSKAEMVVIDTSGHQLLQDTPEIIKAVMDKIVSWINEQVVSG